MRNINQALKPGSWGWRQVQSPLVCFVLSLGALTPCASAQCAAGWVPGIGEPGTDGTVCALAVLPGGDLIVAHSFTTAGGVPANNIARCNPSTNAWSALGSGVNGSIDALAVLPGGDLVVGGAHITVAGGVVVSNVARYNPASGTWSALGSGIDGLSSHVFALAVLPGGDVLVGGFFDTAGGVPARGIARYSPSLNTWTALGPGVDGFVRALAVLPGGDVVVGGDFMTAGGVTGTRNIARLDPHTPGWSSLGGGIGDANAGDVSAITVRPGGELIVGGAFTSAGNVQARNVASYEPVTNTWSALGSGTDAGVACFGLVPGGDVIVAGYFRIAGDAPAEHIARYSPSANTWSPLGPGTDNVVRALALLPDGDLVAGGTFGAAGGVAAHSIARYTLGGPCCGSADFDHDGDTATDADIEAFFACLAGNCCAACDSADFNGDGDSATDADIEAFFRVLAGGAC